ncbi:hypothetical protein SJAG_02195 [Schizosaccharomyces japonicus yFS275]|uniref:Uncharacterized protein n=1 Tax=Schizosaccharomyces japonicus (strain yFS275 / FY16936) TaxID=402676 RepID=B6K1T3_SCHJY|nr:hypothetical protein SJAG_02195 [Schizosaccharomyces japonicus yFS275]EEB07114.1 hypothetical protein SJAG_02195 [Schizosaccharomyces japonicus yFS275]
MQENRTLVNEQPNVFPGSTSANPSKSALNIISETIGNIDYLYEQNDLFVTQNILLQRALCLSESSKLSMLDEMKTVIQFSQNTETRLDRLTLENERLLKESETCERLCSEFRQENQYLANAFTDLKELRLEEELHLKAIAARMFKLVGSDPTQVSQTNALSRLKTAAEMLEAEWPLKNETIRSLQEKVKQLQDELKLSASRSNQTHEIFNGPNLIAAHQLETFNENTQQEFELCQSCLARLHKAHSESRVNNILRNLSNYANADPSGPNELENVAEVSCAQLEPSSKSSDIYLSEDAFSS